MSHSPFLPSSSSSLCSLFPSPPSSRSPLHSFLSSLSSLLLPLSAHAQSFTDFFSPLPPLPPRYPAPPRVVAIGDVHGDVSAMRAALRAANVIDAADRWVGGKTALVQVGDQMDRGGTEREVYGLLFKLQDDAVKTGGKVHILVGNHELMNAKLDFRYVSREGFQDFEREKGRPKMERVSRESRRMLNMLPPFMRKRAERVVAGGDLMTELARRSEVSVIVGDSVFVHGGITPTHLRKMGREGGETDIAERLGRLNDDTRRFLMGEADVPDVLKGAGSPLWLRDYSRVSVTGGSQACKMLAETLKMLKVKRMIVGHTPQAQGINAACGGKVWRIDTGMSRAYGGKPEAIEIGKKGVVRIFDRKGIIQASGRLR